MNKHTSNTSSWFHESQNSSQLTESKEIEDKKEQQVKCSKREVVQKIEGAKQAFILCKFACVCQEPICYIIGLRQCLYSEIHL